LAHSEKYFKKFSGLAQRNQEIYQKVMQLPFISRKSKFLDFVKEIEKSKDVSQSEKD